MLVFCELLLAMLCQDICLAVQVWEGAVQAATGKGIHAGAVAAAAMFVLVVTRTNDEWASWSEHDNMFVRCACLIQHSRQCHFSHVNKFQSCQHISIMSTHFYYSTSFPVILFQTLLEPVPIILIITKFMCCHNLCLV